MLGLTYIYPLDSGRPRAVSSFHRCRGQAPRSSPSRGDRRAPCRSASTLIVTVPPAGNAGENVRTSRIGTSSGKLEATFVRVHPDPPVPNPTASMSGPLDPAWSRMAVAMRGPAISRAPTTRHPIRSGRRRPGPARPPGGIEPVGGPGDAAPGSKGAAGASLGSADAAAGAASLGGSVMPDARSAGMDGLLSSLGSGPRVSVPTRSGARSVMDTSFPEDARAGSSFRPVSAEPKGLTNLTRVATTVRAPFRRRSARVEIEPLSPSSQPEGVYKALLLSCAMETNARVVHDRFGRPYGCGAPLAPYRRSHGTP